MQKTLCMMLTISIFFVFSCSIAEELIPYENNGKWGYTNNALEVMIDAQWDEASYFRNGEVAIVGILLQDGTLLRGLINSAGEYLVPCKYHILAGESESFFGGEEGYYLIFDRKNKLAGYYDMENEYFCSPKYGDVDISLKNDENVISVSDSVTGFRGFIYADTEIPIGNFCYIETGSWNNGMAIATSLDAQWIQFKDGSTKAIPNMYNAESSIEHGLFVVSNSKNKYGLMNLNMEIVTTNWYDWISINHMGEFYGIYQGKEEIVYPQRN